MVSGSDGLLRCGEADVFELELGTYRLIEREAPSGYLPKTDPVVITVTDKGVTYDEGTYLSSDGSGLEYDAAEAVYTIKVSNHAVYELPASGSIGTYPHTVCGVAALSTALLLFAEDLRKPGSRSRRTSRR